MITMLIWRENGVHDITKKSKGRDEINAILTSEYMNFVLICYILLYL